MKKFVLVAFILLTGFKTLAQSHLKSVQVTSVWSPANVRIDGKIDEWEDNFQAYNKTTKLFYTLSNNEKYLYLAVTCTDAANNTKIAAGGITLTINTAGKKKEKDAVSITYPVVNRTGRGGRGVGRFGRSQQSGQTDTAAVNAAHRQFIASSKEIKVLGIKAVEDTLISIYNEYSIKTAIGYDTLGNYNYELAIPLKLLGINDSSAEIAYNIKVNGLQVAANAGGRGGFEGGGGGGRGGRTGGGGVAISNGLGDNMRVTNTDYDLTSPTDFWGKYVLAKK